MSDISGSFRFTVKDRTPRDHNRSRRAHKPSRKMHYREASFRNIEFSLALQTMFFFFSNSMGIGGSIIISIVVTLLLVYACSGP